ncbi:MAG: carbohydrate ABC transporter permease [Eubacteriales bacterium]|nr:carbohydrate ABC transporter permease [Eubacteriales bacterium]
MLFVSRRKRIQRSVPERVGNAVIVLILLLFAFSTTYPFWHVLMYSISDSGQAMSGGLFFLPRDPTLVSYDVLFRTKQIFIAYGNTIWKTLIGTVLSLALSALTAFPLAHRKLPGRNLLSMVFFFTMLFSGGMIPTYLVVQQLGMIDTPWALILPNVLSAYNMFIIRNYFQQLPSSLEESAFIDGATPPVVLWRIVLPISAPILAANAMFYGVGNWNSYLDCILYTNSNTLQTLQVYLRNLISSVGSMDSIAGVGGATASLSEETIKMTAISVSVIPVLVAYPFLQRYYASGITVGAVKG